MQLNLPLELYSFAIVFYWVLSGAIVQSLFIKIDKYLPEISLREYLFNRNELLLAQLKKISKQDLLDFVDRNINEQNRKRFVIIGN